MKRVTDDKVSNPIKCQPLFFVDYHFLFHSFSGDEKEKRFQQNETANLVKQFERLWKTEIRKNWTFWWSNE